MASTKKYFHDHLVLLLLSINVFMALAGSIFLLVSLSTGHSSTYIVQCRDCSNQAAVNKFTNGGVVNLISLAVFAILIMVVHVALSLRAYKINRQLAIAVLSLGILLLTLTVIVSNSLLLLR